MKELMFMWEIPTTILGGLKTACSGLPEVFSQIVNLSLENSYQYKYLINNSVGANDT